MSKFLTPPCYNGRALETQWMNNIFQSHDLFCGCLEPINHLTFLINQQKCHRSTLDDADGQGKGKDTEEIGVDIGDLEELFKETDEQIG